MFFYVASDIHSFYEPFISALNEAGFDANNEEHWLIVCGDCFDRGPDSIKLLHFLMTLERKILIRGNHDLLLEACCKRGFPAWHDAGNGTKRTISDLGNYENSISFEKCCQATLDKTAAYRDTLINYFETKNYIFVHSWIPTITSYDEGASKPWHQVGKYYKYKEDWRKANDAEWEEAMWCNPFKMAQNGLNETGKTIVFGHWHCSYGYCLNDPDGVYDDFDDPVCWEPYINTQQGIIGIDRCTAHTGEVNILVLEDDFLETLE